MTFERIPEAGIKLELKKHYDSAKAVMGAAFPSVAERKQDGLGADSVFERTHLVSDKSVVPTPNNDMEIL